MGQLNRRGYTLVEIMIGVAILGILGAVVTNLFIGGVRFWRLSIAKSEIQRDARTYLDAIGRTLRQAQASTVTIDRLNSSQPAYSRISFTTIQGKSMAYYQNGIRLCQLINGSTYYLADNLRNIYFTFPRTDDADIVSISLCFEKATYTGGTKALHLSVEKIRIMN